MTTHPHKRPRRDHQPKSEYAKDFEDQIWLQRWLCYYCEKPMAIASDGSGAQAPNQVTRDHYVAKSNRGTHVVAACRRCNGMKADDLNAEIFKWAVGQLLKNLDVSAAWHSYTPGMDKILFRMVRIEIWKEKQKEDCNIYRERRIKKETDTVLALIAKLKP
jgi:hypothetical protein